MLAAYCFLLLLLLLLVVGYLTFSYFWLLWIPYFWLRVREFEFKNFAFRVGNE